MEKISLICTIASLVIFVGFLAISIRKFKFQPSYSDFSPLWDKAVPIHNMHLWSIITFFFGALLIPALCELGQSNPWQFLGFFAPIYLIIVAIFPLEEITDKDSEDDKKRKERNRKIHTFAAAACAVIATLWVILVCKIYWLLPVSLLIAWCMAYATATVKSSYIFWLEMAAFGAVYAAIFLIGG